MRTEFWTLARPATMRPVWPPDMPNTNSMPASWRTRPTSSAAGVSSRSRRSTAIGSDAVVRVVIELADDAGDAGLRRAEVIAAVAVAPELAALAQRIDRTSDLAPVLAADGLDEVGIEVRPGAQRLLHGLEP